MRNTARFTAEQDARVAAEADVDAKQEGGFVILGFGKHAYGYLPTKDAEHIELDALQNIMKLSPDASIIARCTLQNGQWKEVLTEATVGGGSRAGP